MEMDDNTIKDGNPIYCKFCGSKLAIVNELVGYDEMTGKPIILQIKKCKSGCNQHGRAW